MQAFLVAESSGNQQNVEASYVFYNEDIRHYLKMADQVVGQNIVVEILVCKPRPQKSFHLSFDGPLFVFLLWCFVSDLW